MNIDENLSKYKSDVYTIIWDDQIWQRAENMNRENDTERTSKLSLNSWANNWPLGYRRWDTYCVRDMRRILWKLLSMLFDHESRYVGIGELARY